MSPAIDDSKIDTDAKKRTIVRAVSGDIVAEYDNKTTAAYVRMDLSHRWKSLMHFVVLVNANGCVVDEARLPDEVTGVLLTQCSLSLNEWVNVIHEHAKLNDSIGVKLAFTQIREDLHLIQEHIDVMEVVRAVLYDASLNQIEQNYTDPSEQESVGESYVEYVETICESLGEDVLALVKNTTENRDSLLYMSCLRGDNIGVASLLKYSARYGTVDLNMKSSTGHTPLLVATLVNSVDVVRTLLEADADANACGQYGRTCLLIAAHHGFVDIVKLITTKFRSRVDVNGEDRYGQTALLAASFHGFEEIVVDLLHAGARIVEDKHTNDAMTLAKQRGHTAIVSHLESQRNCS